MIACLQSGYVVKEWNSLGNAENREVNFQQREYDYAELEAMLLGGNF